MKALAERRVGDVLVSVTWSWTNWTVGAWWERRRLRHPVAGVDLGPLEVVARYRPPPHTRRRR